METAHLVQAELHSVHKDKPALVRDKSSRLQWMDTLMADLMSIAALHGGIRIASPRRVCANMATWGENWGHLVTATPCGSLTSNEAICFYDEVTDSFSEYWRRAARVK